MWVATESNPTAQYRSRRPGDPTLRRGWKYPRRSSEASGIGPALELQSLPKRRGIARDPISFDEGEGHGYRDIDLPFDNATQSSPHVEASSSKGWQYTTPLPPVPAVMRDHPYATHYNLEEGFSGSTGARRKEDRIDLQVVISRS